MKKVQFTTILAVLVTAISLPLYAQKQEIGRINYEVRDYDRLWQYEVPADKRQYTWKEVQVHFTNSIDESYLPREEPHSYTGEDGNRYIYTEEKGILITNYYSSEKYGRLYWFTSKHYPGKNKEFVSKVNNVCLVLNEKFPGNKFTWVDNTDFDSEEPYFIGAMSRKDENGIPYYSFRVEFIIYKE